MKIAFIGGGVMGEAILAAVLSKGLSTAQTTFVSDVSEARRQYLEQKYCVGLTNDNRLAAERGDVVILAVKPQNLAQAMTDLNGRLKPGQLVLSIIAGARIETLCRGLNHNYVVRAMPNTPAQIGEGMTVWTATPAVTAEQKGWAAAILGALGNEIHVDDEKYIDMATAVSGSGPAYVFLFIESLVDAGVLIGLPRGMAQELVLHTLLGSAHFLQKSGKTPAELRNMVTSPGGTTAEALFKFEKGGFAGLVIEAVLACYEKAKKLGG